MFYIQAAEESLAGELVRHLDDPRWARFRAAVAWARVSGVALLREALKRFLRRGGAATIVVGVDLTGTTRQGLQSLLDMGVHGSLEVWVYHDEGGSVFHPKVYLFTGSGDARLTVGSSNMTGGGLAANVEVSLSTGGTPGVPPVSDAEGMFAAWEAIVGDTSIPETEKVVRRLDDGFLAELVAEGYVPDEEQVRAEQRSRGRQRRDGGLPRRLFGRTPARASRARAGTRAATAASSAQRAVESGRVLLMRLRRAAAARPTQVQIPKPVLDTGFFGAAPWAAYSTSGQRRPISVAKASGSPNTRKMEMPEVRHFNDIFARFTSDGMRVTYEVHDVSSTTGAAIRQALLDGFGTLPPRSRQTGGGSTPRPNSTWWFL